MTMKKIDSVLLEHSGHELTCNASEDPIDGIEDCVELQCKTCNTTIFSCDIEYNDDKKTVWMLTIMNAIGCEFFIIRDEYTARAQLYEYVKENWKDEFPNQELPKDQERAIGDYFFDNERESFTLVEQDLLEAVV